MTDDAAVRAAQDIVRTRHIYPMHPADVARVAVEAARPYIEADALTKAADDFKASGHGIAALDHWLRARAAARTGPGK